MKKKMYPASYPMKVPFSKVAVVGDLVFVSGCSGQTLETFHVSSNDVVEQTEVALDKVRQALKEAGTTMDHIFKTVLYLRNMEDYDRVEERRQDYYRRYAPKLVDEPPCDTLIGVTALHEPDMLVELETTAVMPD